MLTLRENRRISCFPVETKPSTTSWATSAKFPCQSSLEGSGRGRDPQTGKTYGPGQQ